MSDWDFEDDDQRKNFQEPIHTENCGQKLKLVREVSGLSRRELADALGCSESTVVRIETKKTLPTEDFMNRLRALTVIGHHKFKTLSDAEKSTLNDIFTAAGGGIGGRNSRSCWINRCSISFWFCRRIICSRYHIGVSSNWRWYTIGWCWCNSSYSSSGRFSWLWLGKRHSIGLRGKLSGY